MSLVTIYMVTETANGLTLASAKVLRRKDRYVFQAGDGNLGLHGSKTIAVGYYTVAETPAVALKKHRARLKTTIDYHARGYHEAKGKAAAFEKWIALRIVKAGS